MPERETIPDLPVGGLERALLEAFDRLGVDRLRLADLQASARPATGEAVELALACLLASGCLHEIAGQYERTALGRIEVAGPLDLTLLTRPGCHLCEEALRQIQPLLPTEGAHLHVVDIDTDRSLRHLYGNDIPVVFLGSREIARHRVDPDELRRELARVGRCR